MSALGSAPGVCLYITSYEAVKGVLLNLPRSSSPMVQFRDQPFLTDFCAGFSAEIVSCLIWVPIDVLKERLQVQRARANSQEALYWYV